MISRSRFGIRKGQTLDRQGWLVRQRSFTVGERSLNEQDLHDNLAYFKDSQAGIESIRSKLAFQIFDGYANILKGMSLVQYEIQLTPKRQ